VPEDVRPFYSTMFRVPKPGKVLEQGVLALGSKKITWKTYINDFLTKRGFVMEDIATFCLLVQALDLDGSIDGRRFLDGGESRLADVGQMMVYLLRVKRVQ
jgi:hypothetical protein